MAAVDLFDGQSLESLPGPNLDGLTPRGLALANVAWSADGAVLFAGGPYYEGKGCPVLAWADAGQGERRALQAGIDDTITGLAALPDGGLLVAAADPFLAVLGADGSVRWARSSPNVNFRLQYKTLAISAEGAIVDFGFEMRGASPLRIDLRAHKLSHDPPADDQTIRPKQDGLPIEHWINERHPTLHGQPIALEPDDLSRSLAVHPDGSRFVLGTEWFLQAQNAKGELLWRRDAPGAVAAVKAQPPDICHPGRKPVLWWLWASPKRPGLRKIIESAQPFSSKMHSRFHRRCTPIFMKVHTQGAVLRTHARVDSGI